MSLKDETSRLIIRDADDHSVRARYEALKDEKYKTESWVEPILEPDFEKYKEKYLGSSKLLRKTIKLKSSPDIIIGDMALANPDTSHTRSICFGMGIYPAHQGKGYGKEALEWLIHKAFEIDEGKWMAMRLDTLEWNLRAQALYTGRGSKICGRFSNYGSHDGKHSDLVCMEMTRAQYEAMYWVAKGGDSAE